MDEEAYEKMIDEQMERGSKKCFQCFTGEEHEYQTAIQTDEYMNERKIYVDSIFLLADEKNIKRMIIKDFNQWRKNK